MQKAPLPACVKRTQQRAVPLIDVDKNIPGTLSNIVSKCLEKEPANRYQSADELVRDLRAWQDKGRQIPYLRFVRQLRMNRLARIALAAVRHIGRSDSGHRSRNLRGTPSKGNRPRNRRIMSG